MNTVTGPIIRHPQEIPIEVQSVGLRAQDCLPACNAGLAELVVEVSRCINVGEVVVVSMPSVNQGARICGKVIWLAKSADGYVIAVSFYSEKDAFRMRMIEQICHIEVYKKQVLAREGRALSDEEAAAEWITCFAASFPNMLAKAA